MILETITCLGDEEMEWALEKIHTEGRRVRAMEKGRSNAEWVIELWPKRQQQLELFCKSADYNLQICNRPSRNSPQLPQLTITSATSTQGSARDEV